MERLILFWTCGIACPHDDADNDLTNFYELKSMGNLKCLVLSRFSQYQHLRLQTELPDVEISHDFSDGIAKLRMYWTQKSVANGM